MKSITKEWLESAKDDLDVIEAIVAEENLTNMVAFHSQQAVEKILKAIIEEFEVGFIKTHKLEVLLETVKNHINFTIDLELIKKLDEVYINARYPTDLGLLPYGKPSTEEAKQFYAFAIGLFGNVRKILGRDQ